MHYIDFYLNFFTMAQSLYNGTTAKSMSPMGVWKSRNPESGIRNPEPEPETETETEPETELEPELKLRPG